MAHIRFRINATNGKHLSLHGDRAGMSIFMVDRDGGSKSVDLLRKDVRALRDVLNLALGEPHATPEEVHTVASVARDLALEEAAVLVQEGAPHGGADALAMRIRGLKNPGNVMSIPRSIVDKERNEPE